MIRPVGWIEGGCARGGEAPGASSTSVSLICGDRVRRSHAPANSRLDDALANAADYGWRASHSEYFWGLRLHALVAADGTPRALEAVLSQGRGESGCDLLLPRRRDLAQPSTPTPPPAPSSTPAPHRAQPRREQSDETVGVNPRAAHVGHVARTAAEPVLPPHESNRPASGTPRGAIATI